MQKAIQEAKKMIEEEILNRQQTVSSWNWNSEYYSYCDGRKSSLEELIERLEKIPQDNGWISVEDRLPEESWIYIVYHTEYWIRDISFSKPDNEWGYLMQSRITHWQPLPLPPTT